MNNKFSCKVYGLKVCAKLVGEARKNLLGLLWYGEIGQLHSGATQGQLMDMEIRVPEMGECQE